MLGQNDVTCAIPVSFLCHKEISGCSAKLSKLAFSIDTQMCLLLISDICLNRKFIKSHREAWGGEKCATCVNIINVLSTIFWAFYNTQRDTA